MQNDFENIKKSAEDFYKNEDFEQALECFKKCCELNPNDAMMFNMVGHLYKKLGAYEYIDEQIHWYKKALEIKPNYSAVLRNLAFALCRSARHEEAFECFKSLFDTKDAIPDDYFFYGCTKLTLGDFEEGWKHYEQRFSKQFGQPPFPKIEKPQWQGEEIVDKTLLVHYEQGFGDTIQFCRYLEQLKPIVGKIIFVVQDEMFDLVSLNLADIQVVNASAGLENIEFDYYLPLLSLPFVLKAQIDDIPFSQGYLKANREKIQKYKKEYFDNDCFKIGISWHGATLGNKRRNVPLRYFQALGALENVKLYSFQKGTAANALKKLPQNLEIIDLGSTFKDFSDTAAAMENIDLFITSDNAVFNLAGAMGKKTFVLLSKDAEWRWFLDEEKTPWYQSVTIFRKQNELEDWSVQMEKVLNEFKNQFQG